MCTYGSNSLPPTPLGMVALKPRPTVGSNLRPFLSACCIRSCGVSCSFGDMVTTPRSQSTRGQGRRAAPHYKANGWGSNNVSSEGAVIRQRKSRAHGTAHRRYVDKNQTLSWQPFLVGRVEAAGPACIARGLAGQHPHVENGGVLCGHDRRKALKRC